MEIAKHETGERLAVLEATIQNGLKTFIEVGNALLEIRDRNLYREQGYTTFQDYCCKRWQMGRAHAYRLIDAASVAANLSPMGDVPATERQARELAVLPPELQLQVWGLLTEEKPQPTAKEIRAAIQYLLSCSAEMGPGDVFQNAKEWRDIAKQAGERWLRDERKAGGILRLLKESPPEAHAEILAADAGQFTYEDCQLWKQLARVPEDFFEKYLQDWLAADCGKELLAEDVIAAWAGSSK